MLAVVLLPIVLQLSLPLALLGWLAFGRHRSRAAWLLTALLTACYVVAIALAGLWLVLPWYLPLVYGLLFPLALVRSGRGREKHTRWPTGTWQRLGTLGLAAALLLLTGATIRIALGRRDPPHAVELAFPLAEGTYLVANGGGHRTINSHLMTLTEERYRRWRGQSHGVDLVALDRWGRRARGLAPRYPEAYAIFGDSIFAPCSGRVVRSMDGLEDLRPPQVDRRHMEGNHVVVECAGRWIVLGHMMQGSVRVHTGESVTVGRPLGLVGNSGNSDEPHLHVHAQRPGTAAAPIEAEPLPILFDGWFPVRNGRISGRRP